MKIFYPFTVKLEPNSHYNVTGTVEALVSGHLGIYKSVTLLLKSFLLMRIFP